MEAMTLGIPTRGVACCPCYGDPITLVVSSWLVAGLLSFFHFGGSSQPCYDWPSDSAE